MSIPLQIFMVNNKIRQVIPKLLASHFPSSFLNHHIDVIIGYGSGVFPQTAKPVNNTIDLLMVVKSLNKTHEYLLNHEQTTKDYTGLSRILKTPYINMLNKLIFPVHFNHPIIDGTKIKYGVIENKTFEEDLRNWNLLTFAGRMHKPVWYDVMNSNFDMEKSITENHRRALGITLLRLISKINDKQVQLSYLYEEITHLSYLGDIRHSLAIQNQMKTQNIVRHNYQLFNRIYCPIIQRLSKKLAGGQQIIKLQNNKLKIHYTPQLISKLCQSEYMPGSVMKHLDSVYAQEIDKPLGYRLMMNGVSELPRQINKCIGDINRKSSSWMALQNFLGSSPIHNFNYVLTKLKKRYNK